MKKKYFDKKSLLEKAKEIDNHRKPKTLLNEDERIELALAWLKNEIGFKQIREGTNLYGSNVYNLLSIAIRRAYETGKIIIK